MFYISQLSLTVMPRDHRQRNRNIRTRIGPFPQNEYILSRVDYELLRNQIISLPSNIQIIADLLNILIFSFLSQGQQNGNLTFLIFEN